MTGSKDKDTLDSLYKEAFEQAPNNASANGWDVPSAKVWTQIQTEIEQTPPPAAASGSAWAWLAASVGLVAILSFAWYVNQTKTSKTTTKVETTTETAATAVAPTAEIATITETSTAETAKIEEAPIAQTVAKPKGVKKPNVAPQTPKSSSILVPSAETSTEVPVNQAGVELLAPKNTKEKVKQTVQTQATKVEETIEKTEEIKTKPRFLNNLDRIKAEAEARDMEAMPKMRDLLAPLKAKPISPVSL